MKRRIGRLERLAYERAERDADRLPPLGYSFDEEAAERAAAFFPGYLRHHKGEWAGKPFILAPWQEFCVRQLFGWKRPNGSRRFRESYLEVARKNGKTELAAGIGLYMLVGDQEDGAEVYSVATKRDQARICWEAASRMVQQNPELSKYIKILRSNMHFEGRVSKFEPLSADAKTMDGLNPHCAIQDELHEHVNRDVGDKIATGMGARKQPLDFKITTAGLYDPTRIGWETHEYAEKVLMGTLEDEEFFAFIAAMDIGHPETPDDDWTDPRNWEKANPNLGVSVYMEHLQKQAKRAQAQTSYENTFKRLHGNVWTEQVTRWLSMEKWAATAGEMAKDSELVQKRCFAGLDLSQKIDLTAGILVFPDEGGIYRVKCHFWMPKSAVLERAAADRVPYDAWVRDGWISTTPGDYIDFGFIKTEILRWADEYDLQEVGYDPWSASQLAVELEEEGVTMVQMRQGYGTMSEPCKELERLVIAKLLHHGDNPVLNWMASNVAITEDSAANIKMAKDVSVGKIDGMQALAMALGRATLHVQQPAFTGELLVI